MPALQEIAQIPAPRASSLRTTSNLSRPRPASTLPPAIWPHATDYMNRVQAHYAKLKTLPPPSVDVENAWLLYNTGNDRALYPA
jgi:hypothetical protein